MCAYIHNYIKVYVAANIITKFMIDYQILLHNTYHLGMLCLARANEIHGRREALCQIRRTNRGAPLVAVEGI